MTKEDVSALRDRIKELEEENKRLKEANTKLQEERDDLFELCQSLRGWLDQLGRGSLKLFANMKDQLTSIQEKIEQFEKESPLSFLEF